MPALVAGSAVAVGLTESSCRLEGCDSWGVSVEVLELTAVVSMVMVGLED